MGSCAVYEGGTWGHMVLCAQVAHIQHRLQIIVMSFRVVLHLGHWVGAVEGAGALGRLIWIRPLALAAVSWCDLAYSAVVSWVVWYPRRWKKPVNNSFCTAHRCALALYMAQETSSIAWSVSLGLPLPMHLKIECRPLRGVQRSGTARGSHSVCWWILASAACIFFAHLPTFWGSGGIQWSGGPVDIRLLGWAR